MNEREVVRHVQIGGISLFFDTLDYRTPHVHPELEVLLVLDGGLTVRCGQQENVAAPGELVLLGSNQPHEFFTAPGGCTFLCLQVAPDCFSPAYPSLEQLSFGSVFPEKLSADGKEALRQELLMLARCYLQQQPDYQLECLGRAALLVRHLLDGVPVRRVSAAEAGDRRRRTARLERLLHFVDENYMHKIRLADFAAAENVTMSYMSHFVRDMLNQSFQEYVGAVRLHSACKRIQESDARLLDICVESGFSDYRYFARAFRLNYGLSPEEYRKSRTQPEPQVRLHHSLHSRERFYTREASLQLLRQYEREDPSP